MTDHTNAPATDDKKDDDKKDDLTTGVEMGKEDAQHDHDAEKKHDDHKDDTKKSS